MRRCGMTATTRMTPAAGMAAAAEVAPAPAARMREHRR
jgi:hypothetical protein